MNIPHQRIEISFCVSCRNRLSQLRETLGRNLSEIHEPHSLALVNFGSDDGMGEWVWSKHGAEIEAGSLRFFEVLSETDWSSPKAKNLAHRIARGNYFFNLDADNRVTREDIQQIETAAAKGLACHQWSGAHDGSFGRIGVPKRIFYELGGYDEAFLPMTWQDADLIERLLEGGYKIRKLRPPAMQAIQHDMGRKMQELSVAGQSAGDTHRLVDKFNRRMSKLKRALQGSVRKGGFASFEGLLNAERVILDGFGNIHKLS